jgi:hypothetical protein
MGVSNMSNNKNVLLASITSAYNIARVDARARFALKVVPGTRVLNVDAADYVYFTRTEGQTLSGLTLSQLESAYLKYDLRGVQLFLENNCVLEGGAK